MPLRGQLTKGLQMKLFYDDKQIPMWAEWLAVVLTGVILSAIFIAFI
jgi:hypothetical protein